MKITKIGQCQKSQQSLSFNITMIVQQTKSQQELDQRQNSLNKGKIYSRADHRPAKNKRIKNGVNGRQEERRIDQTSNDESSNNESYSPYSQPEIRSISGTKGLLNSKESSQNHLQNNKIDDELSVNATSLTNPFLYLLLKIWDKNLIEKQAFPLAQRIFLEKFVQMDQQGLFNDEERSLLNILVHSHRSHCHQMPSQSQYQIKPYVSDKGHQGDCQAAILENKNKKQDGQFKTVELRKKIFDQNAISKKSNKPLLLLNKRHQFFMKFLTKSMKKLKIQAPIKLLCRSLRVQQQSHISKHPIATFLNKLIVIKNFFPQYFPQIIKQFVTNIEQCKVNKKSFIVESGIELLIPRYLNCVEVYSESDNIIAAAQQFYNRQNIPIVSKRNDWIDDYLPNYQEQVKRKAYEWELQKGRYDFTKQQIDSLSQYLPEQNAVSLKRNENKKNVSFEAFKQKYCHWNPMQNPKCFQLHISDVNPAELPSFLRPQIQLAMPK